MSMDSNNDRDTDFNLWAMGDPESGQYEVGAGSRILLVPGTGGWDAGGGLSFLCCRWWDTTQAWRSRSTGWDDPSPG